MILEVKHNLYFTRFLITVVVSWTAEKGRGAGGPWPPTF